MPFVLKVVMQNYNDFADVILFFSCLYYFYIPGDAGMVNRYTHLAMS